MRWSILAVVLLAGCLGAPADGPPNEAGPSDAAGLDGQADEDHEAQGLQGQDPDDGPAPADDPAVPTTITYGKEIHWDQEVAAMLMGSSGFDEERLQVPVTLEATVIEARLDWDDEQDVDLHAAAPRPCGNTMGNIVDCMTGAATQDGTAGWWTDLDGHYGAPDAPSTIEVRGPDIDRFACDASVCAWSFDVWNKDVVQDLRMVLEVTVTYPDGVPEDVLTDDVIGTA